MVRESFNHQVKHLFSMQYSTAELRHLALEDVLAGPEKLHGDLLTKLPELQAKRKQYADAQTTPDPEAFPPVRREKPPKKGQDPTQPKGRVGQLVAAATSAVRQARPVRALAERHPEARLAAMDAKWWMIAQFDSVVVSMPDGTSASWYQRDTEEFRDLLAADRRDPPAALPRVAGAGPALPPGAARTSSRPTSGPRPSTPRRPRRSRDAQSDRSPRQAGAGTRSDAPARTPELVSPFAGGGLLDVFRRRYLLKLLVQKEIQRALPGLPPRPALVLRAAAGPVLHVLLRDRPDPGAAQDVPNFAIHMFSALVGVHFFTETFSAGTRAIVRNKAIVRKMAMPREMFPVASVIVSAIHTFPQMLILFVASIAVRLAPGRPGRSSPASSASRSSRCSAPRLALLFSAMNVFFKDFQNIVATFMHFTHWIVPMIYPLEARHQQPRRAPVLLRLPLQPARPRRCC